MSATGDYTSFLFSSFCLGVLPVTTSPKALCFSFVCGFPTAGRPFRSRRALGHRTARRYDQNKDFRTTTFGARQLKMSRLRAAPIGLTNRPAKADVPGNPPAGRVPGAAARGAGSNRRCPGEAGDGQSSDTKSTSWRRSRVRPFAVPQ